MTNGDQPRVGRTVAPQREEVLILSPRSDRATRDSHAVTGTDQPGPDQT